MTTHMRDIREVAPLTANVAPFLFGKNIPEDLSTIRRGSVAIVIRRSGPQQGQEVLMIKRAARENDHWSGHLALPGGRQDPGETDFETSVRETSEEVGIDLSKCADYLGPIDPRLIRIKWGTKIALILCPFVFSLRDEFHDLPLTPQDTEVAAVFWYPLSKLFDSQHRTVESIPFASRFSAFHPYLTRLLGWQVGDITFDGANVYPSLTTATMDTLPKTPWVVWGITWGILRDLQLLIDDRPSVNDVLLPSFKAWDIRALLFLFSFASVRRKRRMYASSQADWATKIFDGHFKYFPYAIGSALMLRLGIILFLVKAMLRRVRK